MKNLKIIYIIVQFGMLFAQEELPSSVIENKDSSKLDSLNIEVENSIKEKDKDSDSLKVESDSTSATNIEVRDSSEVESINSENDSTEIEITGLNKIEKKYNQLKTYLENPKIRKIIIGAGIVVPIIYVLTKNKEDKKEVIGSPPEWPS